MGYITAILLGYLLGCSSMALYVSKLMKKDIRNAGSGNLGATNATVLFGWKAGILVALHDIGKAALAVYLGQKLFPALRYAGAVAGVACVLGHIFPFYLKFRGGKGFASYVGMTLVLNWRLVLALVPVGVLVSLVTDYGVLGIMSCIVTVPVYLGVANHSWVLGGILAVATLVMIWRHRENFSRMLSGQELGFRSIIRGENRMK